MKRRFQSAHARGQNLVNSCYFDLLCVSVPLWLLSYNRTYSNSNGLPFTPAAGAAIQLAILPGSVTGCIKLPTYSRSSIVGSHSDLRCSNSFFEIKVPCRSK